MVTNRPGIAVGVGTADCGPILFADPAAHVVAAAHAGWRGALAGILESTIDAMESLGATPRRHRRRARADDLAEELRSRRANWSPPSRPTIRRTPASSSRATGPAMPGSTCPASSSPVSRAAGVLAADLGRCTYADEERFYSYRRATHRGEPDYGRLLSAIALED